MSNRTVQLALDRFAVALSTVCALHCVLTPVALVMLPVLASSLLADEGFHRLMLWLILPSSAIAITLGCRRHKDLGVLLAGAAGMLVLLLTAMVGHDLAGETGERILTVLGAAVLSAGHIRNFRLCRRADCEH